MQFDEEFFDQVGLSQMKATDKGAFGSYARERLEISVGARFTSQMNPQQIEELNKMLDHPDKQILAGWLAKHLPNYKSVVSEELGRLKAEIKANAPAILAAGQQPPQQPPVAMSG